MQYQFIVFEQAIIASHGKSYNNIYILYNAKHMVHLIPARFALSIFFKHTIASKILVWPLSKHSTHFLLRTGDAIIFQWISADLRMAISISTTSLYDSGFSWKLHSRGDKHCRTRSTWYAYNIPRYYSYCRILLCAPTGLFYCIVQYDTSLTKPPAPPTIMQAYNDRKI